MVCSRSEVRNGLYCRLGNRLIEPFMPPPHGNQNPHVNMCAWFHHIQASKAMVLCYKLSCSWQYFWNLTRVRQVELPLTLHKNQETCCVSYLTFLLSHFFLFNSYLDAVIVHSFFMDLVSILSYRFNCSQSVILKISFLLSLLEHLYAFKPCFSVSVFVL